MVPCPSHPQPSQKNREWKKDLVFCPKGQAGRSVVRRANMFFHPPPSCHLLVYLLTQDAAILPSVFESNLSLVHFSARRGDGSPSPLTSALPMPPVSPSTKDSSCLSHLALLGCLATALASCSTKGCCRWWTHGRKTGTGLGREGERDRNGEGREKDREHPSPPKEQPTSTEPQARDENAGGSSTGTSPEMATLAVASLTTT